MCAYECLLVYVRSYVWLIEMCLCANKCLLVYVRSYVWLIEMFLCVHMGVYLCMCSIALVCVCGFPRFRLLIHLWLSDG